jgi:hypothetical protein
MVNSLHVSNHEHHISKNPNRNRVNSGKSKKTESRKSRLSSFNDMDKISQGKYLKFNFIQLQLYFQMT